MMNSDFPLIVITPQGFIEGEVETIIALFEAGLDKLHVRKQGRNEQEVLQFIESIPSQYYDRIVVHYYPEIARELRLGGVHFRYTDYKGQEYDGTISVAIHNWDEFYEVNDKVDYVFISPVFDSISKGQYESNPELLIIPPSGGDTKIIALGGIDETKVFEAAEIGYDGAAVLGYIWNNPENAITNYTKLKQACEAITV